MALHHRDYDVVCTEDYGRIQISLILGIMHACGLPCVPGSLSSLPAPAPEESLGTRLGKGLLCQTNPPGNIMDYQLSMFTVLLEFEESRALVNIPDAWSPPITFLRSWKKS